MKCITIVKSIMVTLNFINITTGTKSSSKNSCMFYVECDTMSATKQTTGGMEMYYVRGSELESFLRCRLKWKYSYLDELTPKKPNNKMFPGSLAHKWLETWYDTGLDNGAAWNAMNKMYMETDVSMMDQLELDDLWDTVQKVMANYSKEYAQQDMHTETVATELTFRIPLDDEIGYTGTIDRLYTDEQGLWVTDHKLTSSIETYDKNSSMDRQISRYLWAVQQLQEGNGELKTKSEPEEWLPVSESGLDFSNLQGFVYDLLLRDYPVPPKVLKNGSLSKDKSQKTTYEMYRKALEEHGIWKHQTGTWPPSEYEDILVHLSQNPKEFFRRIRVTRTQSEIDASMNELYMTAMDMHPIFGSTPLIYRNITKECLWCPFQPICAASMDGSNVDYLVESLYTKGE